MALITQETNTILTAVSDIDAMFAMDSDGGAGVSVSGLSPNPNAPHAGHHVVDLGSVFPIGVQVSAGTVGIAQNGSRIDIMWCLDDNVLVADPNGPIAPGPALSVVNDRAPNFINGIHNGHEISHLGAVVTGSYVKAGTPSANSGTNAGTADVYYCRRDNVICVDSIS